jgi:hypothetical protein
VGVTAARAIRDQYVQARLVASRAAPATRSGDRKLRSQGGSKKGSTTSKRPSAKDKPEPEPHITYDQSNPLDYNPEPLYEEDGEFITMDTSILSVKTHLPDALKKLTKEELHIKLGHVGPGVFKNGKRCLVCLAVRGNTHRRYTKIHAFIPLKVGWFFSTNIFTLDT